MPRATLTLALLGALAAPLAAQAPVRSIDPGMTQAQVVERLGEPTAARTSGNFTYLFYKNGCGKVCGMDDIVLLENDAVVDAVFRAPERAYTGKSSSPYAIPADVAARTRPGARDVPVPTDEVIQAGKPRETPPAEPVEPAAKPPEEAKTEPKAETKTEPKVETKTEPKAETKTQTKTEPKAETKPAPTAKPAGTTTGTLRIPIKTQPRTPGASKDSSRAGGAGGKTPT